MYFICYKLKEYKRRIEEERYNNILIVFVFITHKTFNSIVFLYIESAAGK